MLRTKTKKSYIKRAVKIKHHGRIYFVNKTRLKYILERIGINKKINFLNDDLREFLFKNKFLYTEFLQFISDGVKTFNK